MDDPKKSNLRIGSILLFLTLEDGRCTGEIKPRIAMEKFHLTRRGLFLLVKWIWN
jgi:hypothetical protein